MLGARRRRTFHHRSLTGRLGRSLGHGARSRGGDAASTSVTTAPVCPGALSLTRTTGGMARRERFALPDDGSGGEQTPADNATCRLYRSLQMLG
jgi:hypothetical protein